MSTSPQGPPLPGPSPSAPPAAGALAPPHRAHEGFMRRLVRAFLTGPLSPLFLVVATACGAIAVIATPREEEPQIVVPTADVLVSFPGASAEEVEHLVATPLEKLLWQIEGVEHVYSISRRDGAMVTVRFLVGNDREKALVRIQSRIDAHRDEAPPGVAGWVVKPVEIDDVPIVALTLWSPTADGGTIRRVAEELAARLDATPDLSKTEVIGGLRREVRVELDPEALAGHGLSPLAVAGAVRAADAALSAGGFDRADRRTGVAAGPFLRSREEVEALVVGAHADRPVHLRDVAKVIDGPEELASAARISFGAAVAKAEGVEAGRAFPAVTVALSKKKGTNAVAVAEDVLARARAVARDVLPSDVRMQSHPRLGRDGRREGGRAPDPPPARHRDGRRARRLRARLARGAHRRGGRADHVRADAAREPARGLHDQPRDALRARALARARRATTRSWTSRTSTATSPAGGSRRSTPCSRPSTRCGRP